MQLKERKASFTYVLNEAIKTINFIETQVHIFWMFCVIKRMVCINHLCRIPARGTAFVSKKSTWAIVSVELHGCFFMKHIFLLERMTDRKTVVIQTWIYGEIYKKWMKKKEWVSLSLQGKQYLLPIQGFKEKLEFLESSYSPLWLWAWHLLNT